MQLTKEQFRDNAAAMIALADGNPIEVWHNNQWESYPLIPNDWHRFHYRPKPEPMQRPWSSREDFPKLETPIWLKSNGAPSEWMVIGVSERGVSTRGSFHSWADLRDFKWATFKTEYKPCTITEEAK